MSFPSNVSDSKNKKLHIQNSNRISSSIIIIFIGAFTLVFTVLFIYPLFLPEIITSENSLWIQQLGYIFYTMTFASIILIAYGIRKLLKTWSYKLNSVSSLPANSIVFADMSILSKLSSLFKIIIAIISDKKYSRFFYPISITYAIFYALVSSLLIYRPDVSLSSAYGVNIPSIVITSYGQIGYVPAMSIYITDHLGLFIIPINLFVTLAVSSLVGFNGVLSVYAFWNRSKKSFTGTSPILNAVGATAGIFAACPTCASFYVFGIFAGSLAPTVAAFSVTYYSLFLIMSIPFLLLTPILTAFTVRRSTSYSKCSLKKTHP